MSQMSQMQMPQYQPQMAQYQPQMSQMPQMQMPQYQPQMQQAQQFANNAINMGQQVANNAINMGAQVASNALGKGASLALSVSPIGTALKVIKTVMIGAIIFNLLIFILLTFASSIGWWKILTFIAMVGNGIALIALGTTLGRLPI